MKKHLRKALRGLSVAAMLTFASNGFLAAASAPLDGAEEISKPVAMESVVLQEAPQVLAPEPELHHDEVASVAPEDVKKDKRKKRKRSHVKKSHKATKAEHEARQALDWAAWEGSENSLKTKASKITEEEPKTFEELKTKLAGITENELFLETLYRYADNPMTEVEKEEYENLLRNEVARLNIELHQMKELIHIAERNAVVTYEESYALKQELVAGVIHPPKHDKGKEHGKKELGKGKKHHDKKERGVKHKYTAGHKKATHPKRGKGNKAKKAHKGGHKAHSKKQKHESNN
jgi:hypothetical protein